MVADAALDDVVDQHRVSGFQFEAGLVFIAIDCKKIKETEHHFKKKVHRQAFGLVK